MHKPGIVALRPLGLGDIYDGAFKAIRQNPRAIIGMSVVIVTGFLLLPTLVSVVLASLGELSGPVGDRDSMTSGSSDPATGDLGITASIVLGYAGEVLAWLAGLMLTGMIVHVVAQAVLGRRSSSGETWRAVRGRLLALLGLTLLSGLLMVLLVGLAVGAVALLAVFADTVVAVVGGIVLGLALVVALAWAYVRLLLLASPALVLERAGIIQSIRRAYHLSRGQFWRLFGIYLLTGLIVGVVGGLLGLPFALLAMFGGLLAPDAAAGLIYVLATYLGLIVTRTLTIPFTAAVVALQYVDQRIRKEAFDVELLSHAGLAPPPSSTSTY